jgi:predicted nucleic acid-binding protein
MAEQELYRPLWSKDIFEELGRNLREKLDLTDGQTQRLLGVMDEAFPEAMVSTGYQDDVPRMTNDPKDRHVLAAAVRGGAGIIVTENTRDFPMESLSPHGIRALTADQFMSERLLMGPGRVETSLRLQAERLRERPTVEQLLERLAGPCPNFAEAMRNWLDIEDTQAPSPPPQLAIGEAERYTPEPPWRKVRELAEESRTRRASDQPPDPGHELD